MAMVNEKLSNFGYKVFIVPEAATLLMEAGLNKREASFQKYVLEQIIFEEDLLRDAAMNCDGKSVVIADRGAMDGMAYAGADAFSEVIGSLGYKIPDLRDKRYDGVVHLVTAADGAQEFYTLENNRVRDESPEEAILRDREIQKAWLGTPKLKIIGNESSDFKQKKRKAFKAICGILGLPIPLEIERKFSLKNNFDLRSIPVPYQEIHIIQNYLFSENGSEEERIRKRGQDKSYVYFHTIKSAIVGLVRSEREKIISKSEYLDFMKHRNPRLGTIEKRRFCFIWKNQYFELDSFIHPSFKKPLLEIESTEENDKVELPDFLPIDREVTGNHMYSNRYIAEHC